VKASDVEDAVFKQRYARLARAQLSKYELLFLLYNCLTEYGKGFKPLVEEFGLLEHLDRKSLLHPSHEDFSSRRLTSNRIARFFAILVRERT
jgi:hypothetical protein